MATYGDFPGVRVVIEQGGIQSVSVGLEEKVVIFGEPEYESDNTITGTGATGEVTKINAPLEADTVFGEGSEIANGMQDALLNGANIDFLRGVAVPRKDITAEIQGSQMGSLDNVEVYEDTSTITVEDVDETGSVVRTLDVEFRYNPGPNRPTESDTVFINPLTGDYAVDSAADTEFEFTYKHVDYESAFNETDVLSYVNENETGLFFALSDSDAVSSQLATVVDTLRTNYQLVSGFTFAEPNDNYIFDSAETTDVNGGAEPRYNASNYSSANQTVSDSAFFKPAPARIGGEQTETIGGGLAGLYVGNEISNAVYNETVSGYSGLQQSLNKSEADDLRTEDLIPVRSGGSVRVRGNRATNFSEEGSVAADFWTRRITDRVTLIVKLVGDAILGRINNPETRSQTERVILRQLGQLAADGIIRPNEGDETKYNVSVFQEANNNEQVNINVQFTPYGIVKEVDATVTVNV